MSGFSETVRRYYHLVDDNDVPGLIALFAPEAEYRRPGYEPLVGRERIEEFYRGQRVIAHGRHLVTELVADDEAVAVRGTFTGTLKNGEVVNAEFADFFTPSASGLILHRTTYFHVPLI